MRRKAQTRDFLLHVRPFGDSRFPADPLLGTKPYLIIGYLKKQYMPDALFGTGVCPFADTGQL